jgi:hypothetical protein
VDKRGIYARVGSIQRGAHRIRDSGGMHALGCIGGKIDERDDREEVCGMSQHASGGTGMHVPDNS